MGLSGEEIQNRFGYHKATFDGPDATAPKHQIVRAEFQALAHKMEALLPEGRAKSVMFTELENASMWANKAIAETAPVVNE